MRTASDLVSVVDEAQPTLVDWSKADRTRLLERATTILSATPRPFIRWAGSKQRLLSQLVEHLPATWRTYYEPFAGAASMYFLLQPSNAHLNDYCQPLVEMYDTVRREPDAVLAGLSSMDVLDKDFYYEVRKSVPEDPIRRASRFIYLNRAAWNGLYRVNARGEFNVPYGKPRSGNILDEINFFAAANLLSKDGLTLTHRDFEDAVVGAGDGDLVFFDPPYASSKRRESFVDYNETLFTWEDQRRLAACAERLRRSGAKVIVTNAYNSAIRELYPTFTEHALLRRSSLASDVSLRGSVAESVFVT
ncbi:DNA adenine methylase [Lysinimonas soli]|uniref:Site-specific DNA-methyltransferase (adenine-specific) n=1 Tax=Lysinimonas soli TaxID=1074233 RepID=A0ABW0NNE7_9MICO